MGLWLHGYGIEITLLLGIDRQVQDVAAAEAVLADGLPTELGLHGLDQTGADHERIDRAVGRHVHHGRRLTKPISILPGPPAVLALEQPDLRCRIERAGIRG